MKSIVTFAAIAALSALPIVAQAQGKGNGNGNGNGKNHAAQGNNGKGHAKGHKPEKDDRAKDKDKGREARAPGPAKKDRDARPNQTAVVAAPTSNDLLRAVTGLAAANDLIYLTPDVNFATITDEELVTVANCPPGLAKKDPPCVPPGLAKKGVGFDEWAGYDPAALRNLLDDRWTTHDPRPVPGVELGLTQDRIISLFGLPQAPSDQRYAVIDGRPVLLNATDYDRLVTLNSLAQRPTVPDGITILPDAALTQEQLINRYRLPTLADGQNYAVLDNRIITLPDQSYDLLQLIRILGAV